MQGVKMKKFLANIWAYDFHGKFEVESEDNPTSLENAIVDKLGENDIMWERTGMFSRLNRICLLYTSPSPRDRQKSRMPSSA